MAADHQIRHPIAIEIGKIDNRTVGRSLQVIRLAGRIDNHQFASLGQIPGTDIKPIAGPAPVDPAHQVSLAIAIQVAQPRIEIVRTGHDHRGGIVTRFRNSAGIQEKPHLAICRPHHQVGFAIAIPVAKVKTAVRQHQWLAIRFLDRHRRRQ